MARIERPNPDVCQRETVQPTLQVKLIFLADQVRYLKKKGQLAPKCSQPLPKEQCLAQQSESLDRSHEAEQHLQELRNQVMLGKIK